MKRWNGWGTTEVTYSVPDAAQRFLLAAIGPGDTTPDASLDSILARVPRSRLPSHRLVQTGAQVRLEHARGQSLPDWIALRSGRINCFPDGVAYPSTDEDVRDLLSYAVANGIALIPYGGGTSVVGHINPVLGERPVLTVDLSRFDRLHDLDEASQLATLGAGLTGPAIEALLRAHGLALGHYPQSWEYSTLGGWIATRSSGQQSYYYGRIETLFAGAHLETLLGSWELPPIPASAAGPDLRQIVLGSEGRLGIITRATVRVRALPKTEAFEAVLFHDWSHGAAAVREMAQQRVAVSMLRLADADETETTLKLAGRARMIGWAERGFGAAGYGATRALLIYGVTGNPDSVNLARFQVREIAREHGGLNLPVIVGSMWARTRFLAPYLRNTLWEYGYAVDTLETAVPWARVEATATKIKKALVTALQDSGERVWVFAHLSHVYADGASIYVTYLFRRAAEPEVTLARWVVLKSAASDAIVAQGGTISHQHGVGVDHARYLSHEKGRLGMRLLEGVRATLDPDGLMNPGKLLAETE